MVVTLDAILSSAGINPADVEAIRHAFVREHEGTGLPDIHANSSDDAILAYPSQQSSKPRIFPVDSPRSG